MIMMVVVFDRCALAFGGHPGTPWELLCPLDPSFSPLPSFARQHPLPSDGWWERAHTRVVGYRASSVGQEERRVAVHLRSDVIDRRACVLLG